METKLYRQLMSVSSDLVTHVVAGGHSNSPFAASLCARPFLRRCAGASASDAERTTLDRLCPLATRIRKSAGLKPHALGQQFVAVNELPQILDVCC